MPDKIELTANANKQGNQGKEIMSTAAATMYVRKMVEKETSGNGDIDNAMRRLANRYGLSFWQISHLRNGKAKALTIDAFKNIHAAYLRFCAQQIASLEEEMARAKAEYGDDHFTDIGDEIEALRSKVRAAMESHNGH